MVQLETDTGDKMCGVVRYCGDFPGRPGHWVGVEMEEELRGGCNGWVQVKLSTTTPSYLLSVSDQFANLLYLLRKLTFRPF